MLRRELTEILHPVQEDLARVAGLLHGAALAENVEATRGLAKELCARIEGIEAAVAATVAESEAQREESSRLVGAGTDQLAVASANLEGLAKDIAERVSELGSAIETQALVVAPRIVEEVASAFHLPEGEPRQGRLRRRADVGTGLAVAALRQDMEALQKDLASVGPDLDRLTPTLDSLAGRQTQLERKLDSLAEAVTRLGARRETKAAAPTLALSPKERAALASAIAEALASRPGPERARAAGGDGPRAVEQTPAEEPSEDGGDGPRAHGGNGAASKPVQRRRKPRAAAAGAASTGPAVVWSMERSARKDQSV